MHSPLQSARTLYRPVLPRDLKVLNEVDLIEEELFAARSEIKPLFPHTSTLPVVRAKRGTKRSCSVKRIGVVLSGGQASGGHNVIAGLFDALQILHPNSRLFGFLNGPQGIIQGEWEELTAQRISPYRNQGGFDLIGSGRTKIEKEEQLGKALKTALALQLDGLVIVGGDDSNTNAAILAEFFLAQGCPTKVIGVPKTIDGDLKNSFVETSFGFDTATKIYSELIGNIARDALSAKKYYHFIKLMGRTASHITLECALMTHPNSTLIGEEKLTLAQITEHLTTLVLQRAEKGKNYGVCLIPEGLIEFMPEINLLIQELVSTSPDALSSPSREVWKSLPEEIQKQFLLGRDPHGNINVSAIETEHLLSQMVTHSLKKRGFVGKFSPLHHFFGYEGRAGMPSNFDATYCYTLGYGAALLIDQGRSGYMCFVENLTSTPEEWKVGGVPLTGLLHLEERLGVLKPVIAKAVVDFQGSAYATFKRHEKEWALGDCYRFPGPMQFYGDPLLTDALPFTMM